VSKKILQWLINNFAGEMRRPKRGREYSTGEHKFKTKVGTLKRANYLKEIKCVKERLRARKLGKNLIYIGKGT